MNFLVLLICVAVVAGKPLKEKEEHYAAHYDYQKEDASQNYKLVYKAQNEPKGDVESHHEPKDADKVKGLLKETDGTVKEENYAADHKNVFNAEVKKIGQDAQLNKHYTDEKENKKEHLKNHAPSLRSENKERLYHDEEQHLKSKQGDKVKEFHKSKETDTTVSEEHKNGFKTEMKKDTHSVHEAVLVNNNGKKETVLAQHDHYTPVQQSSEYKLNDRRSGDVKTHQETRKDDKVKVVYKLKEADGTAREVHHNAHLKNGFNAEVKNSERTEQPKAHHLQTHEEQEKTAQLEVVPLQYNFKYTVHDDDKEDEKSHRETESDKVKALHTSKDHYTPVYQSSEYKLNDRRSGDVKTHQETRKDDKVKVVYKLKEADGTTREVHHNAHLKNGFNAEVKNSGRTEQPKAHHLQTHEEQEKTAQLEVVPLQYNFKYTVHDDDKEDEKSHRETESDKVKALHTLKKTVTNDARHFVELEKQHDTEDLYVPPHYNFEYNVHDGLSGDMKSHHMTEEGENLKGFHMLKEADGTYGEVLYWF